MIIIITLIISCSADWVCIPEWPMGDGWREALCQKLLESRRSGCKCTIVIVAEGAQDVHGKPGRTGFRGLGL